MQHKNLILLGTSHIAKQSMKEVEDAVYNEKPDIIAIELDRKRLPALLSKNKEIPPLSSIKHIGFKGYIFSIIGAWAERKLGNMVGVAPGSEMKRAVELARENALELALVDQDIQITLKRFSQELTWKEKRRFIADIFRGIFGKTEIQFDLRKVPSKKIIKQMIGKLRERYPGVYKVLIEERNHAIAQNLSNLIKANPDKKILAILGAGHVDEVSELIKSAENEPSYTFSVDDQYI